MINEFTIKVRVRQDDIDKDCHSASGCAVNRAVIRAIKRRFRRWDTHNIGTCHTSTDISQKISLPDSIFCQRRYYKAVHPDAVRAWIAQFDHHEKVEPFETELTFKFDPIRSHT